MDKSKIELLIRAGFQPINQSTMISVSINLDLIDKTKIYQGKKGKYLNIVLFEATGKSAEYSDYIVKQKGEKGEKLPILGNGEVFDSKVTESPSSDLPF